MQQQKSHTQTFIDFVRTKANGCTGVWDGDWRYCCNNHDLDYRLKRVSFFKANWRLKKCIDKKSHFIVWLYFIGTCLFGWIPWWIHSYQQRKRQYHEEWVKKNKLNK